MKNKKQEENTIMGYTIEIVTDSLTHGDNWEHIEKRNAASIILGRVSKKLFQKKPEGKESDASDVHRNAPLKPP